MRPAYFGLFGIAAANVAGATDATCSANCGSMVAAGLQDRILYPGSKAYEARMSSVFSPNARLKSWCIVQPKSSQETAAALNALLGTDCCLVGVRSGGHGIWAGANYIANGVTIDFGNMNETSYDHKTGVASIQPGTNWERVYHVLQEHEVTVAGGRTPGVGVGGFLTGGGISFYTGKYGFACDNVINFEVVLADGSIVNANETANSDLWQALKGGHGNLGLVTRFDMTVFPSTNIWGGTHIYSNDASTSAVEAFTKFADNVVEDPASSVIMIWTYMPQMKQTIILSSIVNTDGVADAPALRELQEIQPLLSAKPRYDTHLNIVKDFDFTPGYHGIWFTITWANSLTMNLYMTSLKDQLVAELMAAFGPDADFTTNWALSPVPSVPAGRVGKRIGNVLGLDRWDTPGVFFCASIAVRGVEANDIGRPILKKYVDKIETKAKELGVFRDWVYINYADGTQDPFSGIGTQSLELLRSAASKYDPSEVFQKRVISGYKIPRAQDESLAADHSRARDEL